MRRKLLVPGTRVLLWPEDTYQKYAVVRKVDRHYVVFEITMVHPGEKHYRVGDVIKIPRPMVRVQPLD